MTWIKLAPTFAEDERWLEAGADAMAVHISALCYSDRHLTDGAISAVMARRVTLAVHPSLADEAIARLVSLKFWDETEGGFQIVAYSDHAYLAEKVIRTRKVWAKDKEWRRQHQVGDHAICPPEKCPAARDAVNLSRSDKGDVSARQSESLTEKRHLSAPPTRPDPTRPQGRGGRGGGKSSAEDSEPESAARLGSSPSSPTDADADTIGEGSRAPHGTPPGWVIPTEPVQIYYMKNGVETLWVP